MERKESVDSAQLNQVIDYLTEYPSAIRTWGHYNSGKFHHEDSFLTNHELTLPERWAVRRGIECLEKTGYFYALGFGEMYAFSIVRLAKEFEDEIAMRRAVFIATNLESFDIDSGIHEAERRLALFNSEDNYLLLRSLAEKRPEDIIKLINHRPIFTNWDDIQFIKQNHHLVYYLSGIDGMKLREAIDKFHPGTMINLIHEHKGALFHSTRKQDCIEVIPEVLSKEYGILLTTTPIDTAYYQEGFEKAQPKGLRKFMGEIPPVDYWAWATFWP